MSLIDAYDYVDKLRGLLLKAGKVLDVSLEFSTIKENSDRVKFLQKILDEFDVKVDGKLRLEKSNAIAESCRTKGNQFYSNHQFLEALESYNQSLCFAEPGSKDVGLAYANRSAVYSELKRYENCLKNIELAKENNYPAESLHKLSKREETNLTMINNEGHSSPGNVPVGVEYFKLTQKANEKLPFIADCLEMKSDKIFGRYITTKSNLRPGDVVCCEEPFTTILMPSQRYKYCATCLNDNYLDLISCTGCTSTMFCSEDCARIGTEKFHKFECPINDKLGTLTTKVLRIAIRTFFEALDVCNGSLTELKALVEENRGSSGTVFDNDAPMTRKGTFQSIDALATNESGRSQSDLFQRSGIVAIACGLFLKHTSLRDILVTEEDKDFFYCFVFKQSQISASNYHGLFNGLATKAELESNPQYGCGSFPFCSLINHSCAPNLVRVTLNNRNYVVINRPIAAGEQLFDNYGFHHCLETLSERQTSLKNQYMFQCSCEACRKNYPLYAELNFIDPKAFNRFVGDNLDKLMQFDVKRAKEKVQPFCNYLKKMDGQYPCYEISSIQECLLRCFSIFAMSEFKLKLCGH